MADQVALLQNGRILAAAAPRELYSAPATAAVANSLGQVNVLIASLHGTVARVVRVQSAPAAASSRERGMVPVRADNNEVSLSAAPGLVGARVTQFDYFGHDSIAHLEAPSAEGVRPVEISAR